MTRADLCGHTKSTPDPQPYNERMKLMVSLISAKEHELLITDS